MLLVCWTAEDKTLFSQKQMTEGGNNNMYHYASQFERLLKFWMAVWRKQDYKNTLVIIFVVFVSTTCHVYVILSF